MSLSVREASMCESMNIDPSAYESARDGYLSATVGVPAVTLAQSDTLRALAAALPRRSLDRWLRRLPVAEQWGEAIERGIASTLPPLGEP